MPFWHLEQRSCHTIVSATRVAYPTIEASEFFNGPLGKRFDLFNIHNITGNGQCASTFCSYFFSDLLDLCSAAGRDDHIGTGFIRLVRPKRLVAESPWRQFTGECQRV